MFICAQLLGILGALFGVVAMYVSDRKQILLFLMLSAFTFMLNMLCLGAISGAAVNVIQLFQLLINYLYKDKYPMYLIIIYIAVALLCGVATFNTIVDILPVIALVMFSISIVQTDERKLKVCMLCVFLSWAVYSFIVMAYSTAIIDVIEFVVTGIFLIETSVRFRKGEVL